MICEDDINYVRAQRDSLNAENWELIQRIIKLENAVYVLTQEIQGMERQLDRRTR